MCAGCQRDETYHTEFGNETSWKYEKCTRLETTDAYGVLTFPGSHSKKADVNHLI